MSPRTAEINNRFGSYTQQIGSMKDVGYEPLAGDPAARFGWNMPLDQATEELVKRVAGKRILEIGPGNGTMVTRPALACPGTAVTVLDIHEEVLSSVQAGVDQDGNSNRLTLIHKSENWWEDQQAIDDVEERVGTVDWIVARQVLQFGSVKSLVNVLQLADRILAPDGQFWIHNMSPYLGYIYQLNHNLHRLPSPRGVLLETILSLNKEFAEHPEGRLPGSEQAFRSVPFVSANFDKFMWFDTNLLRGVLTLSGASLGFVEDDVYYFSPKRIWEDNKLSEGPLTWRECELHVALIRRRPAE